MNNASGSETPTEKAKRLKRKFIEDALLKEAVRDATSHDWHDDSRSVFKEYETKEEAEKDKPTRDAFRDALKAELRGVAKQYEGHDVEDSVHIVNVREMAKRLEHNHSGVLNGGRLFFGVAAKALNVYLKYLTCANFDVRPPDCPFDYGIIDELNPRTGIERKWTFCDKEEDYKEWVRLAKEAAKRGAFESATDWETVEWDAQQHKSK
jgi:hypothetical protein